MISEVENQKRLELYKSGLSDREIAMIIGIKYYQTISHWRKVKKLPPNKSPIISKKENQRRLILWKQGLTDHEIANKIGRVTASIQRWRIRRNLPPNAKSGGQVKKIEVKSTEEWGYFCGVVIGDGYLNSIHYVIEVGSTSSDTIVKCFKNSAKKLNLNPSKIYENNSKDKPKCRCYVCSKILYNALRPYKQKDFHWSIPEFLTTKESQLGFIGGLFDAEGHVAKYELNMGSKHREGLEQVKELLLKFGFKYGKINIRKCSNSFRLEIFGLKNHKLFLDKIELKLKKRRLKEVLKPKLDRINLIKWQKGKMVELYKLNYSDHKICKIIGVNRVTIINWRRKYRLNPHLIHKLLTKNEKLYRLKLYNQSLSDSEMARKFGISKSGVKHWRERNNLIANKYKN